MGRVAAWLVLKSSLLLNLPFLLFFIPPFSCCIFSSSRLGLFWFSWAVLHHDSSLSISSSPIPLSIPLLAALSGSHLFPTPLLTLFVLTHLDSTSCLVFSLFPPHLSPSVSFHCAHTIHPIPFRLIICLDISSPRLFILLFPNIPTPASICHHF